MCKQRSCRGAWPRPSPSGCAWEHGSLPRGCSPGRAAADPLIDASASRNQRHLLVSTHGSISCLNLILSSTFAPVSCIFKFASRRIFWGCLLWCWFLVFALRKTVFKLQIPARLRPFPSLLCLMPGSLLPHTASSAGAAPASATGSTKALKVLKRTERALQRHSPWPSDIACKRSLSCQRCPSAPCYEKNLATPLKTNVLLRTTC